MNTRTRTAFTATATDGRTLRVHRIGDTYEVRYEDTGAMVTIHDAGVLDPFAAIRPLTNIPTLPDARRAMATAADQG